MTKKKWNYDPGDRRFKHKWNRSEAGFDESRGVPIGKCPNSITVKQAERLLKVESSSKCTTKVRG
jgi:hypothetical protein